MDRSEDSVMELVVIIEGMMSKSCASSIESLVTKQDGVMFVKVNLSLKLGYVVYKSTVTASADLINFIRSLGFEVYQENSAATVTATWIHIEGMTCQSCVRHIDATVGGLVGVKAVSVSLEDKLATVLHDKSIINAVDLRDAIDDVGFEAVLEYKVDVDVAASSMKHSSISAVKLDEFFKLATERTSTDALTAASTVQTCVISIEGMTCQSCVKNIESNLSNVAGIISIRVQLLLKSANVVFVPSQIAAVDIVTMIDDMGFEASVSQVISSVTCLNISGMHCQSCVKTIEGHLCGLPGVLSATVSLDQHRCQVVHDNFMITAESLRLAVESSGDFTASIQGDYVVIF